MLIIPATNSMESAKLCSLDNSGESVKLYGVRQTSVESDNPLWSQTNLFGVKSDKFCGLSNYVESDKPLWSRTNLFGVKSDKLCGVSQTLWSRTNLFGVKSDNSLWSQSNSVESDKPLWSWLVSAILSVKLTRSTGVYRSTSNIDNTKLYVNYCIFFFIIIFSLKVSN